MKTLTLPLPPELGLGPADPTLRIEYGLHKIGTQAPHFSVTASSRNTGGCQHELVLAVAPQLADLVALHLSDLHGVPMYPYANGHYWLIGATPSMHHTRRYHGANDSTTVRSPEQCTAVLAKHLRIELSEAQHLVVAANLLFETTGDSEAVGDMLSAYVKALSPRWLQEAQAAIAAHELEIPA